MSGDQPRPPNMRSQEEDFSPNSRFPKLAPLHTEPESPTSPLRAGLSWKKVEVAHGLVSALSADGNSWEICQWSITGTHFCINALTSTKKGKKTKPRAINGDSRTVPLSDIRQLKVGADITEEGYTDDHIQIIIGGRTMASYIMGDVNSYIWMLARDGFEREELVRSLKQGAWAAREAIIEAQKGSFHARKKAAQEKIAELYASTEFQVVTSVMIVANFLITTTEAQLLPAPGSDAEKRFEQMDLAFTMLFTFELLFNMAGNLWIKFWRDSWNWFDFFVVSTSLIGLALESGSPITILRLLRPLRVFRLFRRAQALRQVLSALGHSVVPVMNAFAILLLVSVIYAVLAVSFFGEEYPYFFENFFKALFTMFQVLTGDSWASQIARPILEDYPASSAFFVSYVMLCSMVLINVMVAILLEEFAKAGHLSAMSQVPTRENFSFDILYELVRPLIHLNDEQHEAQYILKTWNKVDVVGKGVVNVGEIRDAVVNAAPLEVKRMKLTPPSIDVLTDNGRFCNEKGEINYEQWSQLMHYHASRYSRGFMKPGGMTGYTPKPTESSGGFLEDAWRASSPRRPSRMMGNETPLPLDGIASAMGGTWLKRVRERSMANQKKLEEHHEKAALDEDRSRALEDKVDVLAGLMNKMYEELLSQSRDRRHCSTCSTCNQHRAATDSSSNRNANNDFKSDVVEGMLRAAEVRDVEVESVGSAGSAIRSLGLYGDALEKGGGREPSKPTDIPARSSFKQAESAPKSQGNGRGEEGRTRNDKEEGRVRLRLSALSPQPRARGRSKDARGQDGEQRSRKGGGARKGGAEPQRGPSGAGAKGWRGERERESGEEGWEEVRARRGSQGELEVGMVPRRSRLSPRGAPERAQASNERGRPVWDQQGGESEGKEWGVRRGSMSGSGSGFGAVFGKISQVLSLPSPPRSGTSYSVRKEEEGGKAKQWSDGWM